MLAGALLVIAFAITVVYRANILPDGSAGPKPKIVVILKSVDYNRISFW